MSRWMVFVAGILGVVAVMIGAYGAHGLENSLIEEGLETEAIEKRLEQCDIAVRYHMVHVLGLLCIGIMGQQVAPKLRSAAAVFFLLGISLFSGGLYSMVFLGQMGHWAIVPSGGLSFMIGWLCLAMTAFLKQANH